MRAGQAFRGAERLKPLPAWGFFLFLCWWGVLAMAGGMAGLAIAEDAHARWEPEIKAFEAADRTNPPPAGGIVFVGSSSIRLWKDLADDFKGLPVINRGFGGSQISDCVFYAARIVLPYRPRQVVLYAGDNDLAAGCSPEKLFEDFQAFVRKVHDALPETQIVFVSIKPSPSRWKLAQQMRTANRLIADFIRTDPRLSFVDVFTPMLDIEGNPRAELYVADKLHMNRQGYAIWASRIQPYLVQK
jgi:lysophospholipase L1-like esterase